MAPPVIVREADLDDPSHQRGLLALMDDYVAEPVVGGDPLSPDARARLIPRLRDQPGGHYFLALQGEEVLGLALCFTGFSTFQARPLLNLHDLAVHSDHRGRGIGRQLLEAVEDRARERGCCRITLEVNTANRARSLYERCGFEGGDPSGVVRLFLSKALPEG